MLGPLIFAALAGSSAVLPSVASMSPLSTSLLSRYSSSCGDTTSLTASCENTTAEANTCCFEAPSGLIQQVQFWDTDPSTGPSDSWTIHGMWPNYCDGTYVEDCDSSRDYTDITSLLENQGGSDTLSYMQTYWISDDESNEKFWEHEWSTHGTCYSTLNPSCLPSGSPEGADAVAFFETVVSLYKTLPTYSWLEQAGITPSNDQTYTLDQITSALQSSFGAMPSFDCDDGTISEVYYWFHLKGSAVDGQFVPVDALQAGSCKSSDLKYPPKSDDDDTNDAASE